MHCWNCGTQLPDDARFCGACGASQEAGDTRSDSGAAHQQEATSSFECGEVSGGSSAPAPKHTVRNALVAIVVVAAVAAAGIVGLRVWQEASVPEFDESSIAEGFVGDPSASVQSAWMTNDDYSHVSTEVTSVKTKDVGDARGKVVDAVVTYENSSFRIKQYWELVYALQDGQWVQSGSSESSRAYEAVGKISDEVLVAKVPSFFERIDEEPRKDSDGKPLYLRELYQTGADFSVVENDTGEGSGDVVISIKGMRGFTSHEGELRVSFWWNGGLEDWDVLDCTVNDGAYEASYDGLVGTWTGEFVETEGRGAADCYGGRSQPPVMTVKSVDSTDSSLTAVVDLSFLLHVHKWLENPAESWAGDEYVTIRDVLITLRPEMTSSYEIYTGDSPAEYKIRICAGNDGNIELEIQTGGKLGDDVSSRTDSFKMTKAASETATEGADAA